MAEKYYSHMRKVKEEFLLQFDAYKELIEFMAKHGITLDELARHYDGDYRELLESKNLCNTEEEYEEMEKDLSKLTIGFETAFKIKYGLNINLTSVSGDADSNEYGAFWEILDCYSRIVRLISSNVICVIDF
jgi:hypothetical protein